MERGAQICLTTIRQAYVHVVCVEVEEDGIRGIAGLRGFCKVA